MSGVQKQVERIKALGLPGLDIRHIGVYVQPSVREVDGELVDTFTAYVGEHEGNFSINFPTKMIFVIMAQDWAFEQFDLDGRTWDGIAVMPSDQDFIVTFGDDTRQSVIVIDECKRFFTYRYQVVLRNTKTGERLVVDPGVGNQDREIPDFPPPPPPPPGDC
ncbi:hypothetical protein ACFELO_02220 [Oceanicaulis sp. LC35]|uniref:hypothetical protein n=1 Tax=Oceanicaulis sp. LC35 TaxID=3349635 RepID=UPI003F857441